VNAERVLTARLRDAQFFWDADRKVTLESRLERLGTLLFHKRLGSYKGKALRLSALAGDVAKAFGASDDDVAHAKTAGRLAKTDLVTDMVREFTELQGTMGGIYARHEGQPEAVWQAIGHQYLPVGVEADQPPRREQLGAGAVAWAALSVADKLDSVVGMFGAGERPTGTRDPFALRRQAQGLLRVLVDLPELTGLNASVSLERLIELVEAAYREVGSSDQTNEPQSTLDPQLDWIVNLKLFLMERLQFLLEKRGFTREETAAVLFRPDVAPLDARRRLEALKAMRGSADFEALAVAFKRVKNIAKGLSAGTTQFAHLSGDAIEAAEQQLFDAIAARRPQIEDAARAGDYRRAFTLAAGFREPVDRFFTDVLVMHDNPAVRERRLQLMATLRDLVLGLADISEIAAEAAQP
jgi:glycyl-tRNA synthetase beta chain